jgi:hypothetical protein
VDAAKSDDKEKLTFMIGEILTIIKTAQNK